MTFRAALLPPAGPWPRKVKIKEAWLSCDEDRGQPTASSPSRVVVSCFCSGGGGARGVWLAVKLTIGAEAGRMGGARLQSAENVEISQNKIIYGGVVRS